MIFQSQRRRLLLVFACSLLTPQLPARAAKLSEVDDWDVAMVQGHRIGHSHTTVRAVEKSAQPAVEVKQSMEIVLKRFGAETRMEVSYRDTETPEGQLLDFELVAKQGGTPMRTTGKVAGNRLEVQVESQGQKQGVSVAWPAGSGGLAAPELSLRSAPLKPGERRTIQHLNFDNQACTTELTAQKEEPVELLSGSCRLLRIDSADRVTDAQGRKTEIKGAYWVDATGLILKSRIEAMNIESYRVTKEIALAKTVAKFDFGEATLVKVDRPIANAHVAKWVRYRLHIDGGDPVAAFPAGPSQAVKRIDDHTAEVTVRAVRPEANAPGSKDVAAPADAPTDDDRKPNNFIQSDDPLIIAQAKEAVGGPDSSTNGDPWKQAVALEAYVHGAMAAADFSQAFATAAEAARNRRGDCKAHAVYLAALARAQKLPARVVIGLVYMPQARTFGGHMWTEVYIISSPGAAGRWIALDATLGKGGIGGGHLQIAHSSMSGVAAYNVFFPVMQVIGRLKIEVLDQE
jgi:hypothetical protein